MTKVVVLARPHLVLSDTGSDDRLTFSHLIQKLDDVLRLDDVLGISKVERIALLPGLDLFVPGTMESEICRLALMAGLGEQTIQFLQRVLDIPVDRQLDHLIFVQFREVNIDMNDRAVLSKFLHFAGDSIIKTNA